MKEEVYEMYTLYITCVIYTDVIVLGGWPIEGVMSDNKTFQSRYKVNNINSKLP